jgi:DNA-binding NtrC family response regulator
MVFADPASQALVKLLARIAPSDVPVMIRGDSGTGKEVVARHIHGTSGRNGPFVAVNCSALADQLAEGNAFFAAAARSSAAAGIRSERWFEAAHQGTLFLDEIADLPPSLQDQLLRALQNSESLHAGSHDSRPADVRLIAATKVDLTDAVSAGHFRLDLFYRLNVGQVRLLPLRQRQGDVPVLAAHFLRNYGKRLSLPLPLLSPEAAVALAQYSWPGNVRELENVIRFALLVAPERELRTEHLKLGGGPALAPVTSTPVPQEQGEPPQTLGGLLLRLFQVPGKRLLSDLENQVVAEAFRFTGRNQVRTAELLGISRNVLRTLLRKHGLLIPRRRKPRNSTTPLPRDEAG